MNKEKLLSLLENHTSIYIDNIARELENTHNQWFDGFGFPIFGATSKDYHEQVYFESYLESYTRELINGIIRSLCDEYVIDQIEWPKQEPFSLCNGYTNCEYEKKVICEFINRDKKIGYKYTFTRDDNIDELLSARNVEKIELVVWQKEDDFLCFEYDDKRIKAVLLIDFFKELLCELDVEEVHVIYNLFVESVTQAVKKANSMISLTTLPGFTPSYLYKTRKETICHIKDEINKLTSFYVKHEDYKETENNSKKLITHYLLPSYFLDKKFELLLVGKSPYAKSFLTSEYLFKYFDRNTLFDYTPIVSGYLKSIEQLLNTICACHKKINHIRENVDLNTMGNYIDYIKNNSDIFRSELQPAKPIIIECLKSYKIESRNNLFHKDYFSDWERVIQIRENTLFLYVTLLGAVNDIYLTNDIKSLEFLNVKYNDLFEILDNENGIFFIEINGKTYTKMYKKQRLKGLTFNLYGIITNTIEFENYDCYPCITVTLSPKNMPTTIWKEDIYGNQTVQIWGN